MEASPRRSVIDAMRSMNRERLIELASFTGHAEPKNGLSGARHRTCQGPCPGTAHVVPEREEPRNVGNVGKCLGKSCDPPTLEDDVTDEESLRVG